jgi:hypothetical protein
MEARCSYLGWTNDGLRQCAAAAVPGLARCEAHLSERTGRSIKHRRATTRVYEGKLRITVPLGRFVRAGGLAWVDDLR